MKEILKTLSLQSIPPGREDKISETIREYLSKSCEEIKVDNLYNTIAIQRSNKQNRKIMVTAHTDEIAMMVSDIDENGFIKFSTIGGIDLRILLAQEVIIHGKNELLGVIGAKPPHILTEKEKKKEIKIENLFIDTGLSAEQIKGVVRIGDYITFKAVWNELQNNMVSSKSLDNRAGLAIMIGIAKELSEHNLVETDVAYVASSQEEVGLRGAAVSAYGIEPDLAIVVDGTFGDMPGVDKEEIYELGKGPAIAVGPNLHKKLTSELINYAKEKNIPYQIDVQPDNTGTDAWAIQTVRDGIPVILVSIPLRYMHTTVEAISIDDLEQTVKLLSQYILSIQGRMEELLCY